MRALDAEELAAFAAEFWSYGTNSQKVIFEIR